MNEPSQIERDILAAAKLVTNSPYRLTDGSPAPTPGTHAADAISRIRKLADDYAFLGATLHTVPAAEVYTEVAAELRTIVGT